MKGTHFRSPLYQGRIQEFEKGGAQHTVFCGPPPASKLAQVPKKLISGGGGGGTPTHFFFLRRGGVATGV